MILCCFFFLNHVALASMFSSFFFLLNWMDTTTLLNLCCKSFGQDYIMLDTAGRSYYGSVIHSVIQ